MFKSSRKCKLYKYTKKYTFEHLMSFVALVYFESKKYPFKTKIYNFLTFMLINLIPYQLDDSTNENTYQKKTSPIIGYS